MRLRNGKQDLHGRTIEVTSVDKVMFPSTGITKGELVDYYAKMAELMFPYLAGRPVALKRYPDGLDSAGFFQKNVSDHAPDWMGRIEIDKRDGGSTDHVAVTEPAALVYLANQGTIEFHGWLATADDLDRNDQIVFDLDPPGEDIDAARAATRRVHELLDELELPHLLKTSGSKGYHVHVLTGRGPEVDAADFAADVAALLAIRHPEQLTDEHRKSAREGRVLVDHFRNRYAQMVVAPYSLRARPGAPVSTPIEWHELGATDPQHYTLHNIFRRLGQRDDPWVEPWQRASYDGTPLREARARLDLLLNRQGPPGSTLRPI